MMDTDMLDLNFKLARRYDNDTLPFLTAVTIKTKTKFYFQLVLFDVFSLLNVMKIHAKLN